MIQSKYPYYLANKPATSNQEIELFDKYSGELVSRVALANASVIDDAIAAAERAAPTMAVLPAYKRQNILHQCVKKFEERFEELAQILCVEAGKPIKDSRTEVSRLIDTFRIAAEESVRIHGEVQELEISSRSEGYSGMWKRVPIGPCSFISPFNFPLNLAAHKIAPAIAAGCPFILKPASLTPVGSLVIGEVLAEIDLPEGAFSILPCKRDGAELFTIDERLKLLSFTGSSEVGWALKAQAGKKKVVLELGGNAACIVDHDAELENTVARIIIGAFYQSGQSCISVQRVIVHDTLYTDFKKALIAAAEQLICGDPKDEATFIGPMINEQEAQRVESWITEAVQCGATLLTGGERDGAMLTPAVLEGVARDAHLFTEEAFGPVVILSPFSDFDAALEDVNSSKFGLQAGIFTRDIYKVHKAWDVLEVGGVVIGDVPSWRVDNMPYGGVKDSGVGREGIRFAIEDMTEIRNLILRKL